MSGFYSETPIWNTDCDQVSANSLNGYFELIFYAMSESFFSFGREQIEEAAVASS